MKDILVANAGSSSAKFQVFAVDGDGRLARSLKGQMDGIGTRPRLRASRLDGRSFVDREYANRDGSRCPCGTANSGRMAEGRAAH